MRLCNRASSLPVPRTSLVNRDRELAAARTLFLDEVVPLLTLTGPGGVGKTRLALAIAEDVAPHFVDGVVLVDLAPLADPALAPNNVAAALGIAGSAEHCLIGAIGARVRSKQMLLILDNCEHVVGEIAELACTLLAMCPALQVLATSRASLRVRGEHVLPVPPLAAPNPETTSLDQVVSSPAVILFTQRARAVDPAFALTATNAEAVAEICWRLDGLPLAVELAAAKVDVLSPETLLSLLKQRLRVLGSGPRDCPARQRTLHSTIVWSYDLLTPEEQELFRRLAVFAGGFDLEAAATTNGMSIEEAIEPLQALLDQSMVVRQEPTLDGDSRFTMLETIRAFGLERLTTAGEEAETRQRHAAYFLNLVERLDLVHSLPGDRSWLDRVVPERDNLRAALEWFAARNDAVALNRLSASLFKLWLSRSELAEGRRWLARAMAHDEGVPALIRSRVRSAKGFLALLQGDYDTAGPLLDEGLYLAREAGDPLRTAQAMLVRGVLASRLGDLVLATTLTEEAERMARGVGAKIAGQLLAGIALGNLGYIALLEGDAEVASARLEEAIRLQRLPGGAWGLSIALCDLGVARAQAGTTEEAAACLVEALALSWSLQNHFHVARALRGTAAVAIRIKQPIRAAQLLGAADRMDDRIGATRYGRDRNIIDWCIAQLGADLESTALANLRRAGEALTFHQAVGAARAVARIALGDDSVAAIWKSADAPDLDPLDDQRVGLIASPLGANGAKPGVLAATAVGLDLTQREREVLRLICQRLTDTEIGERLFISRRTASSHVAHILGKLGAASRHEAANMAVRVGLI